MESRTIIYEKMLKSFRENGVEMARYKIIYPIIEENNGPFNEFYKNIASKCALFTENDLCLAAKNEYENSNERNKRFTFKPYIYSVNCRAQSVEENKISVICDISLFKGKESVSLPLRYAQLWNDAAEKMIPASSALREYHLPRKIRKKFSDGFYISNEGAFLFGNNVKSDGEIGGGYAEIKLERKSRRSEKI